MPKIIKNGLEYSGVPVEVVTAWAPTSDPVQVKEPLMGNTDISEIGDGSITGAISEINAGLSDTESGTLENRTEGILMYIYNPAIHECLVRWYGNANVPSGNIEVSLPAKLSPKDVYPFSQMYNGGYMEVLTNKVVLTFNGNPYSAASVMYMTV